MPTLRILTAAWFGMVAILPGLGIVGILGRDERESLLILQLVTIPALSGAFWAAWLGPAIVTAGSGWGALKQVVGRASAITFLSLVTWAALLVVTAFVGGQLPVAMAVAHGVIGVVLGSLVLVPVGISGGLFLWCIMTPAAPTWPSDIVSRSTRRGPV